MINAYTSSNISKEEAKGGQVNMCTAIQELIEEGRAEGREEGRVEGLEEGFVKGEDMLTALFRKLTPGTKDFDKALNATPAERKRLYKKIRYC